MHCMWYPSMPCSRGVSRPTPGGGGGFPGPHPGGCIPACTEVDLPPWTATDADGTHPTGMHSCYFSYLLLVL